MSEFSIKYPSKSTDILKPEHHNVNHSVSDSNKQTCYVDTYMIKSHNFGRKILYLLQIF